MITHGSPEMALKQPSYDSFTPAMIQTLFWKPQFMVPSPILAHVPFLFWLTGVMQPRRSAVLGAGDGVAHFVLCQAADKIYATGGKVTGFGFWADSGLGERLERPPTALRDHEAMLYGDVSELAPSGSVPEALATLAPGSLDLLFVDLDALPEDYEPDVVEWDEKIAASGLILVHGTKELTNRQPKFVVLSRQLQAQCGLVFRIGNGLSVIIRGDDYPARLRNLLTSCEEGMVPEEIEQVFRRLGEGLYAAALQASTDASLSEAKNTLNSLKMANASLIRSLDETNAALALRSRELADLQARLFDQETELAELRKMRRDREAELSSISDALAHSLAECERHYVESAQLTRMLEDARVLSIANATRSNAAENEARGLRAHLARVQAEAKTAETEARGLRLHLASVQAEAKTAVRALESEQAARAKAEKSAAALKEKVRKMEGDYSALSRALKKASADRQALLDSTSWRLMAPMRKIMTVLKRR